MGFPYYLARLAGVCSVLCASSGRIYLFPPGQSLAAFFLYVVILCVVLLGICWLKGEPPRWRWGNDQIPRLMSDLDAVVIGAGHNGLTCAAYLGMAGLRVRVLERRDIVGGACVTEEFYPGFRNSTAAYTVSLLQPKIIADLKLHEHGLRIVERRVQNFLPLPDGRYLLSGEGRTQREIAKFSARDAVRYPAYQAEIGRVANVLRGLMLSAPPNFSWGRGGPGVALRNLGQLAAAGTRLWKNDGFRAALRLARKSAGSILDGWFEVRSDQGRARLRCGRRQSCEPVRSGLGVCVAASSAR